MHLPSIHPITACSCCSFCQVVPTEAYLYGMELLSTRHLLCLVKHLA